VIADWRENVALHGAALGGAGAFLLFIVLWLPSGPLGPEWARRSGTPTTLLPHSHATAKSSGRAK
jgi:hypothetical protein